LYVLNFYISQMYAHLQACWHIIFVMHHINVVEDNGDAGVGLASSRCLCLLVYVFVFHITFCNLVYIKTVVNSEPPAIPPASIIIRERFDPN
jgi:hypothetical protein